MSSIGYSEQFLGTGCFGAPSFAVSAMFSFLSLPFFFYMEAINSYGLIENIFL